MAELLFVVGDVFTIPGRGLVLCPGWDRDAPPSGVGPGTPIELRRPDGSTRWTIIKGLELISTPPHMFAPILIRGDFRKEDVPPGTEVWTQA
ncbi:MAG: hypothetical protein ABI353_13120 [Isosphaeraceae bacterium]